MTETEAENFLEKEKFPIISRKLTKNYEEAKKYAQKIGFPVVLKIASPELVHKTEKNAVVLNVTKESLKNTYQKLDNIKIKKQGILVQKQIQGKTLILGIKKDPVFKHIIMIGFGGILSELIKDKIVITFIGGIEKHDNLDMVVEAGKKLCNENRKVKFLIVGDGGYLPAVKEKVKEEGLDEEFAFTGWVPFKIINTYLSLADIAILVYSNTLITRYVGTTKLYEYLASGIPVVVHDLPGTREVLEDGYGLLFPCDNTEEFTNQLRKLIENESLREELSKKGRKLIIDKFNVLNQSKKMVDAMKV